MWMNRHEIDEAVERFASHPVLGKYARFLAAFRDEVDEHSDGWPYWKLPIQAADKLMTLLHGHLRGGMGAYPRLPEPTEAEFKKTLTPIKTFYTQHGNKAGMKFPELDPKPVVKVEFVTVRKDVWDAVAFFIESAAHLGTFQAERPEAHQHVCQLALLIESERELSR
jgi:hypothetical protein